jgi:hypothetical protein
MSFVYQKRQIQGRMVSFKDKANQLQQLRLHYARLNAERLNAARLNAERLNALNARTTKKALLVGINYIGTSNALAGCINDVNNVNTYLLSKGFTCQLITDHTVLKPTRDNILYALKQLLVNAVAGDVLVFEYSGHGTYVRDTNRDEVDGYDEAMVCLDRRILDDELKSLLVNHLKKGVTLFVLMDCCHSGTILDLKYQYDGVDKVNPKNLETAGKVYMMSGCMDRQTSADAVIHKQAQGAMTWSLLNTLKTNITWRELLQTMRTLLKKSGYIQIPQLSTGTLEDMDSIVFL